MLKSATGCHKVVSRVESVRVHGIVTEGQASVQGEEGRVCECEGLRCVTSGTAIIETAGTGRSVIGWRVRLRDLQE